VLNKIADLLKKIGLAGTQLQAGPTKHHKKSTGSINIIVKLIYRNKAFYCTNKHMVRQYDKQLQNNFYFTKDHKGAKLFENLTRD